MSDRNSEFLFDRRTLLKGLAAGTAALSAPAIARAATGTIVVGTWGGDYARLLNKNIEKPFLISKGWKVIQDQAGDPERRAKMVAQRMLPRGSDDLQGLSGINMYQVFQQGLTDEIDYSQMKNAPNIRKNFKHKWGIGQIYSAMTPVFMPGKVDAPKSFAEVFDPKYGNKLGLIDIQYQYTSMAAALAAGGGVTDIDGGHKLLLAVRKAGARIYPTNEAFAQGLAAGEIDIGIMWKARTVQWQNSGIKVESVAPSEGAIAYESGFVIPKNAPDKKGAYAYLDAMLEPQAQQNFAKDMGYNPTVTNAPIPAALQKRIGFSEAEVQNLKTPDYDYILKNDAAMKAWWDQDFKG